MFILAMLMHLVFLMSIFDIYFKSPIVENVNVYQPTHEAPADRLALFVIDGLRAESFLNYSTMPYLRDIANSHGRWGISNTRVPTESRPGHVAVIAGFYEDPSAITKGWKENPVDFDSVFNQSTLTWSWGTYDILEIFSKETSQHIIADKFNPYDQTFSSDKNTTLLDNWVFVKVKEFFEDAKHDDNLREKLKSKKIIFFLHLLGTDTSGHTHKPKTENFLTTIKFVDEGIKEIEKLIKDFYNDDGKTAFLMTSDHGMTDWGSHGTGDEHETQTPYVLWGAGAKQINTKESLFDPQTYLMSLQQRYDLNQADLTPLMSTLLAIPVPVNSIGQLPSELLDMTLENKAKAMYSNCRQMMAQYDKKRLDVESNAIELLYHPFQQFPGTKIKEAIKFIEEMFEKEEYDRIITFSQEIMQLSMDGLNYYHNYYQRPLLITVTLSFLGWMVYLLREILKQTLITQVDMSKHNSFNKSQMRINIWVDYIVALATIYSTIVIFFLVFAQNLPFQYYIYFTMPIYLWRFSLTPFGLWIQVSNTLKNNQGLCKLTMEVLCYVFGSLALAVALTHRWVLSVPLLGMSLWPFFSRNKLNKALFIAWTIGCVMLSIFSFMPVVGKNVWIELVILAGVIWLLLHSLYIKERLINENFDLTLTRREIVMGVVQLSLLILTLSVIFVQSKKFETGNALSPALHTICWIIAGFQPIIPMFYSQKMINRLIGTNSAILNFYLLLSVAHEGLFMLTLIINVNCWMLIEFKILDVKKLKINDCNFEMDNVPTKKGLSSMERSINGHDFRRAFFYTLYIILAYFGTGNIASLNSFEVRWVLCFTTSFQPFTITTLILLKTLSPFLVVACGFRAIQHFTRAPVGYLNMIVLIYSNIMGLYMLYHVKNTGSWLEIGTSISQFVIVQVITLFIVIINQIAKVLTEANIFSLIAKIFKSRRKDE